MIECPPLSTIIGFFCRIVSWFCRPSPAAWRFAPSLALRRTFLVSLFLPLALSGCLRTELLRESIPEPVLGLAAMNQKKIELRVTPPDEDSTVGHQFLLVIIPFGSIYLNDPIGHLTRSLYTNLALEGFKPISSELGSAPLSLEVSTEKVQVSAYDFIAIRRIVGKISLRGVLRSADGTIYREWLASGSYSELRPFAFEKQLNHVFQKALTSATEELVRELRL